ncbi:hypothetical protein POTOM_021317 [Populus tomentosa]|uniref:Uncharacterized protein n=1 Tax=Populus tomentosa TaxID=118781 RepID=A0A8X7ZQX6_POPTO|nr:hypothetical protein POTOM_021317 [Populus tomentosa]
MIDQSMIQAEVEAAAAVRGALLELVEVLLEELLEVVVVEQVEEVVVVEVVEEHVKNFSGVICSLGGFPGAGGGVCGGAGGGGCGEGGGGGC